MVHGELSGYIGFDNCSDERLWDFSEVALLTTAATALSAALERRRAFAALARQDDGAGRAAPRQPGHRLEHRLRRGAP